jgi:hypothetical protein
VQLGESNDRLTLRPLYDKYVINCRCGLRKTCGYRRLWAPVPRHCCMAWSVLPLHPHLQTIAYVLRRAQPLDCETGCEISRRSVDAAQQCLHIDISYMYVGAEARRSTWRTATRCTCCERPSGRSTRGMCGSTRRRRLQGRSTATSRGTRWVPELGAARKGVRWVLGYGDGAKHILPRAGMCASFLRVKRREESDTRKGQGADRRTCN